MEELEEIKFETDALIHLSGMPFELKAGTSIFGRKANVDVVRSAGAAVPVSVPAGGGVAPFLVIPCGFGKIEFGDATWYGPDGGNLPALWIGNDGQGLGVERDRNGPANDGETIAMITFANIKGLEALEAAVARVRANMEAVAA